MTTELLDGFASSTLGVEALCSTAQRAIRPRAIASLGRCSFAA